MALTLEQMKRIIIDIETKTDPDDSRMMYNVEMKQWRKKAEADLEEARKDNPNMHYVIPSDIPD